MGLSIPHLLVVLVLVVLVFGTKRLKNTGADLGDAIKEFRNAIKGDEEAKTIADKDSDMLEDKIANKEKDKV